MEKSCELSSLDQSLLYFLLFLAPWTIGLKPKDKLFPILFYVFIEFKRESMFGNA